MSSCSSSTAASKSSTLSAKAGLQFPVHKVWELLRQLIRKQNPSFTISTKAAIVATAVLEYIAAEVIERGGNAATDSGAWLITAQFMHTGVAGHEELTALQHALGFPLLEEKLALPVITTTESAHYIDGIIKVNNQL